MTPDEAGASCFSNARLHLVPPAEKTDSCCSIIALRARDFSLLRGHVGTCSVRGSGAAVLRRVCCAGTLVLSRTSLAVDPTAKHEPIGVRRVSGTSLARPRPNVAVQPQLCAQGTDTLDCSLREPRGHVSRLFTPAHRGYYSRRREDAHFESTSRQF